MRLKLPKLSRVDVIAFIIFLAIIALIIAQGAAPRIFIYQSF